jgi:hypothetical protein
MKVAIAASALVFAASAFAQDTPIPKMFKGMAGQKGQWQMEMLEGGGRAGKGMTMTLCTDNLMKPPASKDGKGAPKADSKCTHRMLKDTADEAVVETTCPERKSTVTMKRESAKSVMMTMDSTGQRGEQHMKMRYTHLGPCREGQGTVTLDKNSEQCKKMREQAAKMDPAKQCARQKDDREACEKRMRDAVAQMQGMCS